MLCVYVFVNYFVACTDRRLRNAVARKRNTSAVWKTELPFSKTKTELWLTNSNLSRNSTARKTSTANDFRLRNSNQIESEFLTWLE